MYVVVNMECSGDEYGLYVVGVYDEWHDAQVAMCANVEWYVRECEWEDGRWEVNDMQAMAFPPSQDDHGQFSRWVMFDTDKDRRWNTWMENGYWAMNCRR